MGKKEIISVANKAERKGSFEQIESRIFTIRGLQVMLGRDLAELYQVLRFSTKRLRGIWIDFRLIFTFN